MISQEKLKILTTLQKLPKNVGDLGKIIVAKGFETLSKVIWSHWMASSTNIGSEYQYLGKEGLEGEDLDKINAMCYVYERQD